MKKLTEKLNKLSPLPFSLAWGLISFLITHLLIGIIIFVIAGSNLPPPAVSMDLKYFFIDGFYVILFYPLVETLIGQWIPIYLMKKTKLSMPWILIIDAIFFASTHILVKGQFSIVVLPGAFVFAYVMFKRLDNSHKQAIGCTYLTHSFHNVLTLLLTVAVRGIS